MVVGVIGNTYQYISNGCSIKGRNLRSLCKDLRKVTNCDYWPLRSQSLDAESSYLRLTVLLQAAVDIMEIRGGTLADRPRMIIRPSDHSLVGARKSCDYRPLQSQSLDAESSYLRLTVLLQAAVDIMEIRGETLADRPRTITAGELFGGRLIIAPPLGGRFHRTRKLAIRNVSTHLLFDSL
jgi:hypothetical protein